MTNVAVYSVQRTATGSTAAVMVPNSSAGATFTNGDEVRPASLTPYKASPAARKVSQWQEGEFNGQVTTKTSDKVRPSKI